MAGSVIRMRRRLPETTSPALNRSRTVTIYFDGRPIEAYIGDTVASAVYGAGIRLFSRSFKYHRPRGLLCCNGRCPNCMVEVDGTPNVRACTTPVAEGMRVTPQNAFPSLEHDALTILDKMDRLLPVGFYYKTFIYPCAAWPFYETVLRNVAGLGRVDFNKDTHAHYVRRHLHPDVAVIGGGPAGLSAALARRLEGRENVEILTGALAFGVYEGHLIGVAQGDTLVELRAGRLVLATGVFEHPLIFQNNDLPGVMLGSAATRLIRLWGVKPAPRAVVVSAHDEGLRVAADLLAAGVKLAAVAEHRTEVPDGPEVRQLAAAGVPLLKGWSIAAARGRGLVEGAVLVQLDQAGRPIPGTERREACSLVAVSTGLETNASLLWQAGGEAALSVKPSPDGRRSALDAAQTELRALEQAFRARVRARPIAAIEHTGRKKFVCPCEDVTLKDIDWAVQEGFDHVETLKRYTTVTMGPCQGRMCRLAAIGLCARETGRSIGATGVT